MPDWPSSVVLGAFDGRYVALYVCARAPEAKARERRDAKGNMGEGGRSDGEGEVVEGRIRRGCCPSPAHPGYEEVTRQGVAWPLSVIKDNDRGRGVDPAVRYGMGCPPIPPG